MLPRAVQEARTKGIEVHRTFYAQHCIYARRPLVHNVTNISRPSRGRHNKAEADTQKVRIDPVLNPQRASAGRRTLLKKNKYAQLDFQ